MADYIRVESGYNTDKLKNVGEPVGEAFRPGMELKKSFEK